MMWPSVRESGSIPRQLSSGERSGARILFIHAPGGFEEFFLELASSLAAAGATRVTPTVAAEVLQPLWTKYGLAVSED